MNAGLPGTGIAGLFYLISIFIIFFYECFLLIRGKSSKKRWITILPQISIASIMIVVGYWISIAFTTWLQIDKQSQGITQNEAQPINPLLVPIIILALVLMTVHTMHFFVFSLNKIKNYHRKK